MNPTRHRQLTPLKYLFSDVQSGTWGEDPDGHEETVLCIRGTDFDRAGIGISDSSAPARFVEPTVLADSLLRRGDLILEKSGGSAAQPVGRVAIFDHPQAAVCSNFTARLRVKDSADPRFVCHYLNSIYWTGQTRQYVKQTTGIQNLDLDAFFTQSCSVPSLEEQRRIADYLDRSSSIIRQIIETRTIQDRLMEERVSAIVDGALSGDQTALRDLDLKMSRTTWSLQKISRVCSILPGYAFPSSGFKLPGEGTRLLRGINIAPGQIDWSVESVSWDDRVDAVEEKFHLQAGDLVIGMDRPWIGRGFRAAIVSNEDLPLLLLQRVARLRARSNVNLHYLRWLFSSSHFRRALEWQATGVSVPHISTDQIASFSFTIPTVGEQILLSTKFAEEAASAEARLRLTREQASTLVERQRSLALAVVTGEVDVATARGVEA